MHRNLLIFFLLVGTAIIQVTGQTTPYSFNHAVSRQVPTETMPAIRAESLLALEGDGDKRGEFSFGVEIPVALNTLNAGLWETLPNGDRLWRLGLHSAHAHTINLLFDRFYLPENATLHIYTADSSHLLGAYTHRHNLPGQTFATTLLPGDHVYLEYYEPAAVRGQGAIHLSTVVHGCKEFYFTTGKHGSSGSCNIDIRYKEGDGYRQAQRAVCMIMNGSKILCSGTLVNNTSQDRTPYVLTAYHCLNTAEAANLVFIFQHEADECQGTTWQEGFSITGSTVVAKNYDSDFALLKLSRTPPVHYHTYYAGWNRMDTAAGAAVSIHHPSGDVKKISLCQQRLTESDNNGESFGTTHWKVPNWQKGTTEGGSSGCGLFNRQQQVIGQLDGGTASCFYREGYDVFGKFAHSWESGGTTSAQQRLKDWLDPLQTGATALNGLDPDSSLYENDVQLLQLLQASGRICRMTLQPTVCWTNNGNRTLTSIHFFYQVDSAAPRHVTIKGNWPYGTSDTIVLDTLHGFPEGSHQLKVWAALTGDENHANDTLRSSFDYHRGATFHWEIKTDYYPTQNRWLLKTAAGDTIASSPEPLHFSTVYRDTFCLQEGCYDFILCDSAGDGFIGREGDWQGYFYLYLQGRCIRSGIQCGYRDSLRFCIDSTVSVKTISKHIPTGTLTLFPNPCQEQLRLRITPLQEGTHQYTVYSMEGRRLMEGTFAGNEAVIAVESLQKGPYLLQIFGVKNNFNKLFIKE